MQITRVRKGPSEHWQLGVPCQAMEYPGELRLINGGTGPVDRSVAT